MTVSEIKIKITIKWWAHPLIIALLGMINLHRFCFKIVKVK